MPTTHEELPDFDALWNYEQPAQTEQVFLTILRRTTDHPLPTYRLELLTQVARAQGLQRRFDDAHRTLDQMERELDGVLAHDGETAAMPPRVRYLLERGRVFNSAGQPERARPLFLAAWELATQSRQDAYAVDAAHMLGIVEPTDEGLEWNRRALARAQASEDPRARRWQGSLYNNMGWTYHDAGEYEQALALFQSALAAWQADAQTDRVPVARWAVARALRSLGRFQEAQALQQELLQEYEHTGRPDGYLHEELGECLLALGREPEARPHFARAWALLSQDPWLAEAEPERLKRLHTLGASDGSATIRE